MSRYRKIDVRIWNDAKFLNLSRDAQFIFLFLLTHPGMTALGAMRASVPGLAAEIKQDLEQFRERFAELIRNCMVEYDETVSYVGLPNFLKYNGPDNPNAVKSWSSALDFIPECRLKLALLTRAKACAESRGKGFSAVLPEPFLEPLAEQFPESFADGSPNQEQEQEQKQEQQQVVNIPPAPKAESPPRSRAFVPPTLDDVTAYCTERGNKVIPAKFIAFYESNGWMVGKNKMKDWRAAVHTWELNDLPASTAPKSGSGLFETLSRFVEKGSAS